MLPEPDYSDGVALMLRVPSEAADQVDLLGMDPENLHITVAYFGSIDDAELSSSRDEFLAYGQQICAETMPFSVTLNGITRFSADGDDGDPLVVNADAPELEDLRRRALDEAPIPPKRNHGYSPHMTIGYLDPSEENPVDRWDTLQVQLTEVVVAWGPDETTVRLGDAQTQEQKMDVITAAADAASGTADSAPAAAQVDLPGGKPMMLPGDTLALTLDDNERVLELIYVDTSGLYVRDNGAWNQIPDGEDPPTVVDREWVDVEPSAIAEYDMKRPESDELTKDDFALAPAA